MLPAVLVGLLYKEYTAVFSLLAAIGCCCFAAFFLYIFCRHSKGNIYPREAFVIAGLGWVLISCFGALPFVFSGEIPHFINAFFETVSGFTTTGSSILVNVEAMSHGMLFWRSLSHWLGGIGILVFILAIVRVHGSGGNALNLLRAETPGPQVGKIRPKIQESVRTLFLIYVGMSIINLFFLLVGGMPLFDALCTMFGTAGTGGFGIKVDSMASYSPYLQNVTTIFMALFGVNFSLYHLLIRKDWRSFLKDEELRLYFGIMLVSSILIAVFLVKGNYFTPGVSFRHSAFTVSSIMTTTGFATTDFDLWPQFTRSLLLVLMLGGAMAGSTGGGMKISRILILVKATKASIHRLLHPRSVKTIRLNGRPLDEEVVKNVYQFLFVYCCILIFSFLVVSIDGLSLDTNISAVFSCFNNIGPGLAAVGPVANFDSFSYLSKIVLSFDMLLGRLEIFPILLLLSPSTWARKN